MRITFYGAAQTTTGSMHLVEANGKRILLDCGLYQGHRKEAFEKNRNLPVDPAKIDYVILSHAHIDHSGNLPQLVRQGFRGRVFARQSTTDLCDVMLRDSCFLQKRDLEYVNKKRRKEGKKPFEPLYDESDVDALMQLFVPTHMHEPREISRGITLEFFNAGHILGSALVQLDIRSDHGHNHRLLFSGDLGQPNQPILRHYEYPAGADILIVESTYADKYHPSADDVELRLERYLKYIDRHNAKLLVPAFSVGRTQQIIYYLNKLRERVGMQARLDLAAANADPDPFLLSEEYGYRNVSGPNQGVILEIRRERAIELCQEGHRYYDLMRWKEGKVFEAPFYGMYLPGVGVYDLDGNGTADFEVYAADSIYQRYKGYEIHGNIVVDADVEVILNGVHEQLGTAECIGCIELVPAVIGDLHIAVTHE